MTRRRFASALRYLGHAVEYRPTVGDPETIVRPDGARPISTGSVKWPELKASFDVSEWAFTAATDRDSTSLHPYPARFISALPRQALALLGPRTTVIDPFCGSGTTLYEGLKAGLQAYGNDLNPIATLISRVRTSSAQDFDQEAALRHATRIADASLCSAEATPNIPKLDHWFPTWAQDALTGATEYLHTLPEHDPWRDRVALAISQSAIRLSRQESDTRYAAIDKSGDRTFASNLLSRAVLRVHQWLQTNGLHSPPQVTVRTGDACDMSSIPSDGADCAVFSPPYPNAYEYWLYHKYRMYWLGYDPISVRRKELGARPHYHGSNPMTEVDFARQMQDVFCELGRILIADSPVVVVVGDSTIGGRIVDNAELLTSAVSGQGFELVSQRDRPILRTRSSFNSSHTRGRKAEHVLLYRSPGPRR